MPIRFILLQKKKKGVLNGTKSPKTKMNSLNFTSNN